MNTTTPTTSITHFSLHLTQQQAECFAVRAAHHHMTPDALHRALIAIFLDGGASGHSEEWEAAKAVV